eukprot:g3186.t1
MFKGATAFDQDIGEWDTGNVEYMTDMLFEAAKFNQDISKWDIQKFERAEHFLEDVLKKAEYKKEYLPKLRKTKGGGG